LKKKHKKGKTMTPYEKSPEFIRLEKLAELEKIVSGSIERAKDSDGEVGLSSIDNKPMQIPDPIKKVIVIRRSINLPIGMMHKAMDEGHDSLLAHISRHKIMMTPGEALYTAMGRKSPDIFEQIKNITIGEILELIQNKAAVASTCRPSPMMLDDFDIPKHISGMIAIRGMKPDTLYKSAKNTDIYDSKVHQIKFEFSNGEEVAKPKKFVESNHKVIQEMIDDGAIIKVVQILSSGKERTVFDKYASADDEDMLYIEMIKKD
jgi:hypothetical protein